MLIKNIKGYYEFEELTKLGISNGFSIIPMGSMRKNADKSVNDIQTFADALNISTNKIIGMEQTHEDNIASVSNIDLGKIIPDCDGLLTSEKNLFLYGTFADCVPVMFFDPVTKIFGIIHAGWKGVFAGIVTKAIEQMEKQGSNHKDIIVAIGPSIRSCCYEISEDLARQFINKFGKDCVVEREGKYYLDMQFIVKQQLGLKNITQENIFDAMMCTKDHADEFFSYRANMQAKTNERFAGIIGRMSL